MLRKWREEELRDVEHDRKEREWAVEQIGALLAGRPPQVQGAILADVLSIWLACWHPTVREEALSLLLTWARDMVPAQEARAKHTK
jgi:hypothetical protein